MNTVYTVLGMITFYAILAYLAYEYVYPFIRAAVDAVRFLAWYDREAKRVDPNHTYKVGIVSRCATAYGQMLGRIRERRAGITSEITHHSGAKFN
jgi:hypothetical protein